MMRVGAMAMNNADTILSKSQKTATLNTVMAYARPMNVVIATMATLVIVDVVCASSILLITCFIIIACAAASPCKAAFLGATHHALTFQAAAETHTM